MGVMECNRNGCGNIMCNMFSSDHGYICSDCFDELVNKGVKTDIDEFMGTEKIGSSSDENDRSLVYFKSIFC